MKKFIHDDFLLQTDYAKELYHYYAKKLHIAIDILPQGLSKKKQNYLDIIVHLIVLLFAVSVFLIGGLRYIYISFALAPVGAVLFIGVGVAKTSIQKVIRPLIPLFLAMIVALILISVFPELSL